MNYWERWIGDWKRKTAHLSLEEKGAYGELLDFMYASETSTLPAAHDASYRIAGAQSMSERKAVDSVLAQFFILDDAGHHQKRTQEEIEKRQVFIERQRELANRRWDAAREEAAHKGNGADKAAEPAPALPEWIPADLYAAWWKAKPKRARTPKAHELAIAKLEELRAAGNDPTAILEHCIRSGYQGIFAPHTANGKHVSPPPATGAKCMYCSDGAVKITNDIPHCARLDHLDMAIARRQ